MRNFLKLGLLLLTTSFILSCSNEDENNVPQPESVLEANFKTDRCKALEIVASSAGVTNAVYEWYLVDSPETKTTATKKKLVGQDNKLIFISPEAGDYVVELDVTIGQSTKFYQTTITVEKETVDYLSCINKVYDFLPAVGQFTNTMPAWTEGLTSQDMCKQVEDQIAKEKNLGMITLGGFGGYVIFGFDHSVVNKKGMCDIRINGNAFWSNTNPNPDASTRGGSCEPGIVSVSIDANHNGLADDQWYEIAGSEYNKETTIKNYSITYNRPAIEEEEPSDEYIKWTDNQGTEGWIAKNGFHNQSYYPLWLQGENYTLTGTKLANNGIGESGEGTYWVQYSYAWGYVDNAKNDDPASAIDLDWAINEDGEFVHLPYVDFIKVHNAVNQVCGWIGETSTEITGAIDLHIANIEITSEEAKQYDTKS